VYLKLSIDAFIWISNRPLTMTVRNSDTVPIQLFSCDILVDNVKRIFGISPSSELQPQTTCMVMIVGNFSAGKHELTITRDKERNVFHLECAED